MTRLTTDIDNALNSLPIDVREVAASTAILASYQHGEYVVRKGEPLPGLMYLHSGAVSLSQAQTDGGESIVCFARQRRWLSGDNVATRSTGCYDACAIGEVQMILWPAQAFIQAYERSEALREFSRETTLGSLSHVLHELEQTRSLTLPQKLARRLLELADMVGYPMDNQAIKLLAPVSNALLASSLGVTRQRIHGQLRDWAALGWVNSSYREVVLHAPDALRQAAAFA
jgi:CRP/FNR family transcriptional regulator, cyclic AMP receptor protein